MKLMNATLWLLVIACILSSSAPNDVHGSESSSLGRQSVQNALQRRTQNAGSLEGLTEAERTIVRAEFAAMHQAISLSRPKLIAAKTALHEAVLADPLDEAVIRARAAEVGKIEADNALIRAKHFARLRAKLPAKTFELIKYNPLGMGGATAGAQRPQGPAGAPPPCRRSGRSAE